MAVALVAVAIVLVISLDVMIHRAVPILKGRIVETLRARFNGRVELDGLDVSVMSGLQVSGDRLRVFPPDDVVAAGAVQPLIALDHFSFHAGLTGLLLEPMHVGLVQVSGLQIQIPPREMRSQAPPQKPGKRGAKIKILVDRIICDNSHLVIGTAKPDKDPKDFELKHIELLNVGPNAPWRYDATLTNAIPRGDIHASGTFGPWQTDAPGDSSVTGHYTFDHADLNTIRGLGGMLSSVGDFQGQLDRISVDGTTDTPNFSLDTANHPMPLRTRFHAVVDGITGDTYLEPVDATLRNSTFTTSGSVISLKGRGRTIELDVYVPQGRIQDFLDLVVKTQPAVLTGIIGTRTKLHIRPGTERVADRLSLRGAFTLQNIHFTNPQVQDKVDMISLRTQGKPKEARPGAQDVKSRMNGTFTLSGGTLQFSKLAYFFPGAQVNLDGVYSLDGEQFDFHGKVLTEVSLSQMVANRVLSFLLRAASPFFRRKGGGAEIPVKISGTRSEPKFGLDLFKGHSSEKE